MPNGTPRLDVLTRARELRAKRYTLAAIAEVLEAEKYPTARGARWSATVVLGLLNRPHPFTASLVPCTVCGELTSIQVRDMPPSACVQARVPPGHPTRRLLRGCASYEGR